MKAIMYHYVRPGSPSCPNLKYLHLDDFKRQLDWLSKNIGILDRPTFEESIRTATPAKGCVLTFDDAFSDHFDHVFPELRLRGIWGIFYVPTSMYRTKNLLDVHKIHLILGRHGGVKALDAMKAIVADEMLTHEGVEEFRSGTYRNHDDDAATILFKRTLNYFIAYEYRAAVTMELMNQLLPEQDCKSFYVTEPQIKEMDSAGMIIGSHTVNHLVMSKLSKKDQKSEIKGSFDYLSGIVGHPIKTFCYPYGGHHTFTDETEGLLTAAGSQFSFNVDHRDITHADLHRRHALPRYDCNQFPHGRVR